MAILDRIAMLIRSNLNALINQAEKTPEKMLDQILIDMRQQLLEAKREVAVTIADEKRLAAQAEARLDQVRSNGTAAPCWPCNRGRLTAGANTGRPETR